MRRSQHQRRRNRHASIESLEHRRVFAANLLNVVPVGEIPNTVGNVLVNTGPGGGTGGGGLDGGTPAASIVELDGTITVQGTGAADRITVDELPSPSGIWWQWSVRVSVTNLSGSHTRAEATFLGVLVDKVIAHGNAGNDHLENASRVATELYGERGNDTLVSGLGDDKLDGGSHNDRYLFANAIDMPVAQTESMRARTGVTTLPQYFRYTKLGTDEINDVSGFDTLDFIGMQQSIIVSATSASLQQVNSSHQLKIGGPLMVERIYGTDFDDVITGSLADDVLLGRGGNDRIYGAWGNDRIYGQGGHDVLFGDSQNDTVYGGSGNDRIYGGTGHDSLHGQSDNDYVYGNGGNDTLGGGPGVDRLFGLSGNDELRGGPDTDFLYGGNHDDLLRGGDGHDYLYGESGNDALWGQQGFDRLRGGAGADRHLVFANATVLDYYIDVVSDEQPEDAVISLSDGRRHSSRVGGVTLVYRASRWTEAEVEMVDRAAGAMHQRTGTTDLLKDEGRNVSVYRVGYVVGDAEAGYLGWNDAQQRLFISQKGVDQGYDGMMKTIVHEFGHNHDTENPRWSSFLALSGWTQQNPNSDDYQQSGDREWWYRRDANFVRNYSHQNPREDFATVFGAYFIDQLGLSYLGEPSQEIVNSVPDKIAFLDSYFNNLASA